MMRIIEAIKTFYEHSVIRVGRAKEHRKLLKMRDRLHANVGFSREYRKAVAELRACSDLELADLGLARVQIEHAVKYGRPS